MSYFRPDLHRYLASHFVDGILHKKSTLYYFLGRTYKWDDENYPDPLPDDSVENDIKIRDNIVYVKKLESNNVTLSIRRINWKKGTIYYQWDSTKEMNATNADKSLKTPYYVMNSNYSVYKCLFNNHGAPSTEEPNEKSYGVLQTSDGYLWKYMYSIPKIQLTRFLSGDYIPCQKAINESFYNLGAVESVVVRDGGMNYKSNTIVQAVVESPKLIKSYIDETKTQFSKEWLTNSEGQTITPRVGRIYIVDSEGDFKNKKYRLDSSESFYEETMDTGVTAEISLNINAEGSITEAKITKYGRGYDSSNPPTITIIDQYGTGSGKYGNPTAILEGNIRNGRLDTVTIKDPGKGYSNDSVTRLVVIGDGSGCVLKPIIEGGKFVSVDVVSAGSGYTHAKINIITEKGPTENYYGNADLIAVLGGNGISTDQGIVEQTATNGPIYAIEVAKGGSGYSQEGTKISIDGDGEGCSCVPVVVDGGIESVSIIDGGEGYSNLDSVLVEDKGGGYGCSLSLTVDENGTITKINVLDCGKNYKDTTKVSVKSETGKNCSLIPEIKDGVLRYINVKSYGKNYTRGNIIITRSSTKKDTDEDAEAYPIISPIGGHGSDAVSELNASTSTIYLALRYADAFGTLDQEFRQFGVISNLTSYKNLISTVYGSPVYLNDTNWLFNQSTGLISKKLLEPVVSVYNPDDNKKDSVQYKIIKTEGYGDTVEDPSTKGYIVDHVNLVNNGNHYLSYKETIDDDGKLVPSTTSVTLTDVEGSKGDGASLIPYIKGSVYSIDILRKGYGFEKTEIDVYDNGVLSEKTKNFVRAKVSREGNITGIRTVISSNDHYSNSTTLDVISKSGSDAELEPVILGGISSVIVEEEGSGYSENTTISIISEKGSGATLTPIITDGKITGVTVTSSGEGYYSDSIRLKVIDVSGSEAVLKPVIKGTINNAIVKNYGKNYRFIESSLSDTSGSGSGCELYENLMDGVIDSVKIDSYGKGYTHPVLSVEDETGSGAILKASCDSEGRIKSVTVVNGGSNYSHEAKIIVTEGSKVPPSSEAKFTPVVLDGLLNSLLILSKGENYVERTTELIVNSNTSYFGTDYKDPIIDITFIGSINSIVVESQGSRYSASPTISVNRIYSPEPYTEEDNAKAEVYMRYVPNSSYNKICLVPLNEDAENFTLVPGYKVEYADNNEIQIYTITDVINDYIPIRTKDSTNTATSEENLCTIFTFKNYNENTGKYPGITRNCDLLFTVTHYNSNEKTENKILYRVINVTGKNILAQPISFIPRSITPSSTEYVGDYVDYSYIENDVETFVRTYVSSVDQCTIDKYSGSLLYVANMKPLEFFEGKVAAVRTNVYF